MNDKKVQSHMISLMAKKSLRSGRLRNIFVMTTIFLSVSLLSVILLFASGTREETKRQLKSSQQAIYFDLTPGQLEALHQDERLSYLLEEKTGITTELADCSITPRYISELSGQIKTGTLKDGTLPNAFHQAAVQAEFLEKIGVKPAIGNSFEIEFYDGSRERFEVSGLLDGSPSVKNFSLILSRDYAETGPQLSGQTYSVYAKIDGSEQLGKEECRELIYQIGTDAGMEYKYISPSKAFLDSLDTDPQMVMMSLCIGTVILLACVLVIYGVFYISVIGRIHQFGQLRTLGMTRRQIRKLVKKEGSSLFIRVFPLGILAGGIAGYLIKPNGWSFRNAAPIFLGVIAVNYAITMISVLKPAKIAANISPIEALRYNTQDEMQQEGNKKICRNLSPLGLGFMNFTKNKRKTVITMLSLGLGGILFVVAATYMTSFDKELYSRQLYFKEGEFDILIPASAVALDENGLSGIQSHTPFDDTLYQKIIQIPGVTKISRHKEFGVQFDYHKNDEYGENNMISLLSEAETKDLEKNLKEGSADYDKLMSGNYVMIRGNDVAGEIYGWEFTVGDSVTFHYWDGAKVQEREAEILGILQDTYKPLPEGWFFLPETVLTGWADFDNFDNRWIVSTNPSQEAAAGESLRKILQDEPLLTMETLQERRDMDRTSISKLFSAITGLSIFIMMFSILSMMNTLITNIVTRKQELAMLQSIGMTKKQMRRMILSECFTLAGINLLITILFGSGAGYALCVLLERVGGIHYMAFRFPVWFLLAYAGILLLVPAVITITAMHQFSREALVERLHGMEC